MKILHVNTNSFGGAAKSAIRIHEGLIGKGVESYMLFRKGYPGGVQHAATFAEQASLIKRSVRKVRPQMALRFQQRLEGRPSGFENFSFLDNAVDITQHPFYQKADIINFHWVANFPDIAKFFSLNQKPVVWSLCDINPFSGGCHYPAGCDGFTTGCEVCPQLEGVKDPSWSGRQLAIKKGAYQRLGSKLVFVSPTKWMDSLVRQSQTSNNAAFAEIAHATSTHAYRMVDKGAAREVLGMSKDDYVLLFLSGATQVGRKGMDLVFEALQRAQIEHLHLIWVGVPVNPNLPDGIKQTSLGEVREERFLSIVYNAADYVMIPSREDNLPLTFVDSQVCGVPAIGFNSGGLTYHLENGENGIKAEHMNAAALTEALKMGLSKKESWDRKRISERAKERYGQLAVAEQYIDLYNSLLA